MVQIVTSPLHSMSLPQTRAPLVEFTLIIYEMEEVGIHKMAITKAKRQQRTKRMRQNPMRGVETKYFDQYSAGSLAPTGFLAVISDITRGNDVTQRIGNQVLFKRLNFKLTCNIHPNAINAYVRAMIVLDKQGFNAPTIAEIIEPITLSSPYVATAPVYWDYRKRFRVIADKKVVLTQAAITANEISFDLPLNIISQNIGAATTFTNQLYVLLLSTEQNILALPGFYWYSRLEFTDE